MESSPGLPRLIGPVKPSDAPIRPTKPLIRSSTWQKERICAPSPKIVMGSPFVENLVDFDLKREGHIMTHQLEMRVIEQMDYVVLGTRLEVVDT